MDEQNRNVLRFNPGTDDKVCFFDCVYCPLGRTKKKVSELIPSPNLAEAFRVLESALKSGRVDTVLFDTVGDPLLYKDLGDYADLVHQYGASFAVESIGYGLSELEVQKNLKKCDELTLEVQDVSAAMFTKLHRPAESVSFEKLVEGYMKIRDWYHGKLFVKVYFLNRYNDTEENAKFLKQVVELMMPDRLEISNTNDISKLKGFHIGESSFQALKQIFE